MTLPEVTTEKITTIISTVVGRCSIYLFGCREGHYYLLVFTDRTITGTELMHELSRQTNLSATVLVHNTKQLGCARASQSYFFDWVLRHGRRLQLDKGNVPYVLENYPLRDLDSDVRFWHKCVAVAQFNLQAAKESPQVGVTLCKIALLNTACVQLATGLIRVFLGYMPVEFGLKFLFELCGHFTDLPMALFGETSDTEPRLYKMLCAPAGMLIYWVRLDAEELDFEALLSRCEALLEQAGELAATEVNRLAT